VEPLVCARSDRHPVALWLLRNLPIILSIGLPANRVTRNVVQPGEARPWTIYELVVLLGRIEPRAFG
jgi:hypothetical protein